MVSKKSNRKTRPEADPTTGEAKIPPSAGPWVAGVTLIKKIAERFGLTAKQTQFIINYWTGGLNARRAAVAAGYSPKSIGSQAYQLLHNHKISRAIAAVAEAQGIQVDILHARLLQIGLEASMADYEPFLDGEESLKDLERRGVNVKLVKTARKRRWTRTTKDGDTIVSEIREVTLHDPLKAISLVMPPLEATKEVEALERGPGYKYTVGQMLTKEFLEQLPEGLLAGIIEREGIKALPSSDGKAHRRPHRRIEPSGEARGEGPTRDH